MKKTIMLIVAIAMALVVLVGCGKREDQLRIDESIKASAQRSLDYDPDTDTLVGVGDMSVMVHHDGTSARTGEINHDRDEVLVIYTNGETETMTRRQWEELKAERG